MSTPSIARASSGETCAKQSAAFLRVAALVPQPTLEVVKQERVGSAHTRVELRVANRGYLGTCGLPSARKLPLSEPLRLTVAGTGVTLVAPAESVVELGHLDGWGAGLYGGASIFMPWTRGSAHERFVTLVVEGKGTLSATVGSCRVGYLTVDVEID